jgi:hypothetical protein
VIGFPAYLDATNVVDELEKGVPNTLKRWLSDRDFHRVTFNVTLRTGEYGLRGATELKLEARLQGDHGRLPPQIDDVGPQTAWVDKAYSAQGEIKLGYGIVGSLLKLLPFGKHLPVPEGSVTFTYKWNPKVASVISSATNQDADWAMTRKPGQYLDGEHELMLLIRRPRDVESLQLVFDRAWARYDVEFAPIDRAYLREEVAIPIHLQDSELS